jgi:alkanesulfonate monooxygenase SsuD/methylene tetrahydromethanopterin reductase-like flavin-dependent oxidoreductase (luciferase family)
MIRLGVVLATPPGELAGRASAFEAAGVESLWIGEYFQSGAVRSAIVASATRRVTVGTHVLQAFAQSPLSIALMAQDLQDLSSGRFVLGLGSQLPAANLAWHGVDVPRPLSRLRGVIEALRTLFAAPVTERVRFEASGVQFQVPGFRPDRQQPPPPVFVGGAGMGSVQLAAEVADGLLGHLFWTLEHLAINVVPLLRGSGDTRPVSVARLAAPATVPSSTADAARRLAHYAATGAYSSILDSAGIVVDQPAVLHDLRTRNTDSLVARTERLREAFSVTTPERLVSELAAAERAGASELVLVLPADVPPARVRDYDNALLTMITAAAR